MSRLRVEGGLYVDDGLEVAVGILQVDQMVVVRGGTAGRGPLGALERLEDLPQILAVAERRVDGDGRAQHGGRDEDLHVRAPDTLAVDAALVDIVSLGDRVVLATAVTAQLVDDQLPHLAQRPVNDNAPTLQTNGGPRSLSLADNTSTGR